MDGWTQTQKGRWMNGEIYGWMNGRSIGGTDGWSDEQTTIEIMYRY